MSDHPVSEPHPSAAVAIERPLRGLLYCLPVIPVGVLAWVLIWQWGFITSIIAFGIAFATAHLYRFGAGGQVGPAGVGVVITVTIVTLVLSFLGGMGADVATFLGIPLLGALTDVEFWDTFAFNLFENPDLWSEYLPDLLFSVLFAALGTFSVFRALARQAGSSR